MWPCHIIVNFWKFKPDFVGWTLTSTMTVNSLSFKWKSVDECTRGSKVPYLGYQAHLVACEQRKTKLAWLIFLHPYLVLGEDRLNLSAMNWWKSDFLEYFSGDLNCSALEFACSNRCIPLTWQCDGDKDCPAGEDESDCCEYC